MSDEEASVGRSSPPVLPPESPGSSVSTRMQEEYSELLRFALSGGLQDAGTDAGDKSAAEASNGAYDPLTTISLSPRQKEEDKEQKASPVQDEESFVDENTNSNNIHHDMSSSRPVCQLPEDDGAQVDNVHGGQSSISIHENVNEMSDKFDILFGKLKGNILAELNRTILKSVEKQKQEDAQQIKDLISEKQSLQHEVNRLGEQIYALEQSLSRKDGLVENLSQAVATSKDKVKMANIFYSTKASASDTKRLAFTEKLAQQHYERNLNQKVLHAWFGTIQSRWRARVSKSCEEHARNVCAQLSQDYEDKIKSLNETVDSLENKVAFLQQERGQYAEQVRKAFMRGVCALNMETMSAFGPDEDLEVDPRTGHSQPRTMPTGPASFQGDNYNINANTQSLPHPSTSSASQDPTFYSQPHPAASMDEIRLSAKDHERRGGATHQSVTLTMPDMSYHSGVIEAGTVGISQTTTAQQKTKAKSSRSKGRPASATTSAPTRHVGKTSGISSQGQPLAPPMASIVVERHNPVTKQTLGKATAVRYPKSTLGQGSKSQPSSLLGQTFKPLAGQSPRTMSVKVVD